jgi:hypothetical protein
VAPAGVPVGVAVPAPVVVPELQAAGTARHVTAVTTVTTRVNCTNGVCRTGPTVGEAVQARC